MPITSNASTREQQQFVKGFVKALGSDAKGVNAQLEFNGDEVEMHFDGHRYLVPMDKMKDWAANGYPRTSSGSPALGRWKAVEGGPTEPPEEAEEAPQKKPAPKRRKAPAKKAEAAKAAPTSKPKAQPKPKATAKPKAEPKVKPKADIKSVRAHSQPEGQTTGIVDDFDDALRALVSEAYAIEEEQQSGELGANAARYKRGLLVLKLDQLKNRAKEEGRPEFSTRKALLELLNRGQLALADERDAIRRFDPIDEGEAATMGKIAETFLAGDIGTRFKLVDTVNPITGDPLVGDDGEAPEVPITEIAPNKLAPLTKHATSENFHQLVSFAHNFNEANVKMAAKLADKAEKPVGEIVKQITDQRRTIVSSVTDKDVQVQFDDDALKLWLKEQMPPSPPSQFYSITTERGWGEGIWEPVKSVLAAINDMHHFATANGESGELSNVFVLERTFTQYFNPHEEGGYQRLIGALMNAGDITEQQASDLVGEYAFDPETNGLRQRTEEEKAQLFGEEEAEDDEGNPVEPENDEPDDDEFDDDEPPFDADLDIDTAKADEEAEEEDEDPEDF